MIPRRVRRAQLACRREFLYTPFTRVQKTLFIYIEHYGKEAFTKAAGRSCRGEASGERRGEKTGLGYHHPRDGWQGEADEGRGRGGGARQLARGRQAHPDRS